MCRTGSCMFIVLSFLSHYEVIVVLLRANGSKCTALKKKRIRYTFYVIFIISLIDLLTLFFYIQYLYYFCLLNEQISIIWQEDNQPKYTSSKGLVSPKQLFHTSSTAFSAISLDLQTGL